MSQSEADDSEFETGSESGSGEEEQQPETTVKATSEIKSSSEEEEEEEEEELETKRSKVETTSEIKSSSSEEQVEEDEEEEEEEEETKRSKEETISTPKKTTNNAGVIKRIFSCEDEKVILEAMAELKSEKDGKSFYKKIFEQIKGSMSFNLEYKQLSKKILNMKNKHLDLATRVAHGEKLGEGTHQLILYKLGAKVWGAETWNLVEEEKNQNHPCFDSAVGKLPYQCIVQEKLKTVDKRGVMEIEPMLKKQRRAEAKVHVRDLELYKETYKLIMEGVEKAES